MEVVLTAVCPVRQRTGVPVNTCVQGEGAREVGTSALKKAAREVPPNGELWRRGPQLEVEERCGGVCRVGHHHRRLVYAELQDPEFESAERNQIQYVVKLEAYVTLCLAMALNSISLTLESVEDYRTEDQ